MIAGKNGVTTKTPGNIQFGACTVHKNLKYVAGTGWNFAESLAGATNGGSTASIVPEVTEVAVDGVYVPTKGLKKKTGEKATVEVNFAELTLDIVKAAAMAMEEEITETGLKDTYTRLVSKSDIAEGDYWENLALVGKTLDDRDVVAIYPNALCTSGFEHSGKSKEAVVGKCTFECHAEITDDGTLDKLPWEIYFPNEK